MMADARIALYDMDGYVQSAGFVSVAGDHVRMGQWFYGSDHVSRRPLGMIRRTALAWAWDGSNRTYTGQDEKTGIVFRIGPASAPWRNQPQAQLTYMRTEHGEYLVQAPDANRWGFTLYSDDQSWEGGLGYGGSWTAVRAREVPQHERDRLGPLSQYRA